MKRKIAFIVSYIIASDYDRYEKIPLYVTEDRETAVAIKHKKEEQIVRIMELSCAIMERLDDPDYEWKAGDEDLYTLARDMSWMCDEIEIDEVTLIN